MSTAIENSKLLIKRARAIAARGLIERDYEGFNVLSPGIDKEAFRIWRDEEGRVRCNCPDFEGRTAEDPRFRCEHILAVKFHLEPPGEERSKESAEGESTSGKNSIDQKGEKEVESHAITIPFERVLKKLSTSLSPELVRQRVGWRDHSGREHEVDYVEWHTVADLLDQICPDWSHQVNEVKQIGDFVAVTVSITIKGVTRQGVGTGSAYDEVGIKKAEHDALKRAAVKFGIARELYRKEEETDFQMKGGETGNTQTPFPREPIAKTMADLVTPKQLVAIRAIANVQGINAESECLKVLRCRPEELSRRAASAFIDHLKSWNAEATDIRQVV